MKFYKFTLFFLAISLAAGMLGCGAADEEIVHEQTNPTQMVVETAAQTEPPVQYEKKTVYLCVGYTTTQTEDGRSRGYVYDYDDQYGRLTYESLSFDGKLDFYKQYYYDDEAQTAYYECFDENGALKSTGGTRITGPDVVIEGTPVERHGVYIYNEDGYIVEETNFDGTTVLCRREYDENYTTMTEIANPDNPEKSFLSREATLDEEGRFVKETVYTKDGDVSVVKVYTYDSLGRVVRIDNSLPNAHMPLEYPWIYEYDEHGNLVRFDADYYYGYETIFQYEPFEILVPVVVD